VSNVTDMYYMFYESKFDKNIYEWNLVNSECLKGYNRKKHLEFLRDNYPEYFFN